MGETWNGLLRPGEGFDSNRTMSLGKYLGAFSPRETSQWVERSPKSQAPAISPGVRCLVQTSVPRLWGMSLHRSLKVQWGTGSKPLVAGPEELYSAPVILPPTSL